jgi:hypothetical protein
MNSTSESDERSLVADAHEELERCLEQMELPGRAGLIRVEQPRQRIAAGSGRLTPAVISQSCS